jgi:hypothetical protein
MTWRPLKGLPGLTATAFPGNTRSSLPCMIAMKRSVVGSGPTFEPGYPFGGLPERSFMCVNIYLRGQVR